MAHYFFVLFFLLNVHAADELCRNISLDSLEKAERDIERISKIAEVEPDYQSYLLRMQSEAKDAAKPGNSKFLKGEKWAMPVVDVQSSGVVNKGLYSGELGGKNWFIKNLGEDADDVVREYHNARKIHALGLGPEAHLVQINKQSYLVMEKVGGINIKELIQSINDSPDILEKINHLLKTNFTDKKLAKKAYARAILADQSLLDEMKKFGQRLHDAHFTDPYDFQFMIAPQTTAGKRELAIIDGSWFKVVPDYQKENLAMAKTNPRRNLESDPRLMMDRIVKKLNDLAYGP